MAKKTTCPITRSQFRQKAKPLTVVINGQPKEAQRKEFSTGSLGWYLNDKISVDIDGTLVSVQIGMNLTIVGSKELPPDDAATEADLRGLQARKEASKDEAASPTSGE